MSSGVGVQSIETMAKEPSFFSCTPDQVTGDISSQLVKATEKIFDVEIENAYDNGLRPIIDVRVQRLMPGMYPSIPGWHCDAVPRDDYFGQPKFDKINPYAMHVTCTISTSDVGVSNTMFYNKGTAFKIEDDEHVFKDLHNQVEARSDEGKTLIPDGMLALFTPKTIHKTMPTHTRGWRLFFRYSMYHKPPVVNKVANQQQVYILSEANGW